jgi:hypothetical protein
MKNHLSYQLTSQWQKKLSQQNSDLLAELEDMLEKAKNIYDRNYKKGRDRIALESLNSQRNVIQLLAQITVKMHEMKAMEIEQQKQQGFSDDEDATASKFWSKVDEILNPAEAEVFKSLYMKILNHEKTTYINFDKDSQIWAENIYLPIDDKSPSKSKNNRANFNSNSKTDKSPGDEKEIDYKQDFEDDFNENKVRPVESEEIGYTRFIDHPSNGGSKFTRRK